MSRTRSGRGCGRGRVAHDQPRLQHPRHRVGAPAVEPFDDRRDRTVGLLAGSWLTEVRSMWLSCASRLLSSRDRDITGHVDPGAPHNLKTVRRRAVDEAASQLHTHRHRALTVLT
ncbi:MAG TPA: hypothetical protein VF328_18885 [Mycobacterium sp.]